jgi:hypothetical protein
MVVALAFSAAAGTVAEGLGVVVAEAPSGLALIAGCAPAELVDGPAAAGAGPVSADGLEDCVTAGAGAPLCALAAATAGAGTGAGAGAGAVAVAGATAPAPASTEVCRVAVPGLRSTTWQRQAAVTRRRQHQHGRNCPTEL